MEALTAVGSNKTEYMIFYASASKNNTSDNIVFVFPVEKEFIVVEKDVHSGGLLKVSKINELKEFENSAHCNFYSTSNSFTLLPSLSLNAIPNEEIKSFLGWSDKSKTETVNSNIDFSDISIVFQDETAFIKESIHSVTFSHMANLVIPYVIRQNWENGICCVTVGNSIFIAVIKAAKFNVFNTFQVSNNEEIMYYIMLFIQEFELSQEESIIEIFGEMQEAPDLEQHLTNFIRNIISYRFQSISDARISGLAQFLSLQQ